MAAGRADLVCQFGAEDIGLDGRALGMKRVFDQARVGLRMLAERYDASDAGFFRAAPQPAELRNVTIEDGGAVFFKSDKDSALASAILASVPRNSR